MKITSQKIGLIGMTMAVFVVSNLIGRAYIANAMSSTNYSVLNDSLNFGGGAASSSSYTANDTLGDIATGEDSSSASYSGCAGFQCFNRADFLSFSVKQGVALPGIAGAGVTLVSIDTGTVASSNGSTVNSIFITANSNADEGFKVTVKGGNGGLQQLSNPAIQIQSATATLSPGTEGYGICVTEVSEAGDSPTSFEASGPYNGICNKSTGHEVGVVDATIRTIVQSSGVLRGGTAEILVKAAVSNLTDAGGDYGDMLTFVAAATY